MTFVALVAAVAMTAAQTKAVDALVKSTLASEHIAGATVGVAVNGKFEYRKAFGFADVAARTRADVDTIYPIGSVTKQFTAACILLLAQEHKLQIDDPLSRYLTGLPWADRVTLRHMLDQESGIVDFRLGVADTSGALAHDDVVKRLAPADLSFAPGSKYEYSNSNYYLLGMVVEKVAGEPYDRFLAQRILAPLGLHSTYYDTGSTPLAALARPYTTNPQGPQPVAPENPDWTFAAGAIATTVADLATWDDALRAGRVIDVSSLHEMFSPGVLDDGSQTDYAFGWVSVRHNGRRLLWHNGEVTGYHAMNAMFPDERTDVIVLTNTGGTFAADSLALRIFDALHPFVATDADRAAADRAMEWVGRIERGDVDRTQLTDQMSAVLTPSVVTAAGAQLRGFGTLKSIAPASIDEDASGRSYTFEIAFAKRTIRWVMGIDKAGKISALSLEL